MNKRHIFCLILTILDISFTIFLFTHSSFATGTSMLPTMSTSNFQLVLPASGNLTEKIVAYKINLFGEDTEIVHRCILDNGTNIITKGDNNPFPDPWYIPRSEVTGIVAFWMSSEAFVIAFILVEIFVNGTILLVARSKKVRT